VTANHLRFLVAVLASVSCVLGGAALAADARKPATHTVTIEGTRFQPEELKIQAGDAVVWVNNDFFPHTATSEAGGFDSKVIRAGKSWKATVTKEGELAYVCTLHPSMKGTLRVE
jgi:plastocyanin